jgi:hypothetical protein
MAAADVALQIILKASDQTSAGLNSATANLSKMEKATSAAKIAFGALSGAAASTLVGALSDAANAAAADEASVLRLQQAVENSGASWDDNASAIAAVIKHGQDLAFTDEQIRSSLSNLTAVTGDVNKAMELNSAAMDLSRGKGIDLATASQIVGRVAEGNVGILKRYGIVLEDGATATEALGALHQKFGGQAEAYGNSTAGSIFKVKDSISEWRESIGYATGPAMGLIALLPGLQTGFVLAGSAVGSVIPVIGSMTAALWAMIPAAVAAVVPFIPLILIVAAVAAAILLAKYAWENNLGDIQGKAQAVIGFLTGLFENFGAFFTNLWNSLPGPVQSAVNAIIAPIRTLIDIIQAAIYWLGQLGAARDVNTAAADAISPNLGAFERGYATGTPYVQFTGPALVHKGEAIIPADQNPWANGGSDREPAAVPQQDPDAGTTIIVQGSLIGLSVDDLARALNDLQRDRQRRIGVLA